MKPLSLLPKYLLITAAICAAAVTLTALILYVTFRSSLDTALNQGALVFQDQMTARIEEHARTTTRVVAERIGGLARNGQGTELAEALSRAAQLDSASLVVLFDAAGQPAAHAGNLALLSQLDDVVAGEVATRGSFIVARMPLPASGAGSGAVGQVFDTTMTNAQASVLRSLLATLVAKYGRDTITGAFVVALVVMAGVFSALVIFARRQVGDIRLLTRGAERMTAGAYDDAIRLPRGDELGRLASAFDELRQRLQTTTISRDYLDKVLASMSEALFIVAPDGRVTRVNAAASRLLDLPEEALVGKPMTALLAPGRGEEFALTDTGARARESALVNQAGREVPVSFTVSEIQDADPASRGFVIAARNIAERKIAEQRIRYLARIDALTKVPNRMQFQHLLQRSIARASRQGRSFALFYLDVDRFKDINDIYGHSAGDLCLETLTERLGRLLPDSTIIGRFAGDEFGLILEAGGGGDSSLHLANTARSILRELARVLPFHGHQIYMTASIGIAVYPTDARNVIDLVRSADSALYHAKRAGGDTFEFFDPEMNAAATERLMLKSKLRRAYQREELLLQYQPKVDLRTGRLAGAEALVRWEMADGGIILPSEFIPLAEESNLILDIGEWVLDRVCRDFQSWQAQMAFPGKIAVNLSLKQLRQPNFAQRVAAICRKHGVPPASLELEITESTLMEDPERTVKILDELYAMGLSLAIDDFGTGYSSLSALQKFPINTLKIDQSFVRDAATDADDATIVSTIIQMGHGLKLDVIAEGVESPHQLAFLRATGCDYVQGLLFGEPLNAPQFVELLMSQRHGNAVYQALFG